MLREEKSEKHGQCILYSTMTAKPKVRRPLIMKCFIWEQAYDKVESDCAMRSLILIFNFILILIQETRILKKIQPYLAIYDIYLFSCKLLQFNLKVSLHWGFVMHRYRIGKKCVKDLPQNLFTTYGVKTVEHFCSNKIGRERLVQLPTVLHGLKSFGMDGSQLSICMFFFPSNASKQKTFCVPYWTELSEIIMNTPSKEFGIISMQRM